MIRVAGVAHAGMQSPHIGGRDGQEDYGVDRESSNGRTAVFEAAYLGPNPSSRTMVAVGQWLAGGLWPRPGAFDSRRSPYPGLA